MKLLDPILKVPERRRRVGVDCSRRDAVADDPVVFGAGAPCSAIGLCTGVWFYLGAFGATLAVGVLAAFVLGNKAASATSYPKPWVAVIDIFLALFLVFFIVRFLRRPRDPKRAQGMVLRPDHGAKVGG